MTKLRFLFVLLITLAAAYIVWQKELKLGLDLKGGISMLLEVNADEALESAIKEIGISLKGNLENENINPERIEAARNADGTQLLRIVGLTDTAALTEKLEEWGHDSSWDFEKTETGLDMIPKSTWIDEQKEDAVNRTAQRITNRIDQYGVTEPSIHVVKNTTRINLSLPGVDDADRVKRLVQEPGQLELHLIRPAYLNAFFNTVAEAKTALGGEVPADLMITPVALAIGQTASDTRYRIVDKEIKMSGSHIVGASRSRDDYGNPSIAFTMNAEGRRLFADVTGDHINWALAIILDNKLVSSPNMPYRIDSQTASITGSFTPDEATDLSTKLKSGALPGSVDVLTESVVGPSLGRQSISRGQMAGGIGVGLVALFMLFWYKGAGINAVIVLALNLLYIIAIMKLMGAVLTLPGIAGFVLTIGMAVDANVLIFERIKEELRDGAKPLGAVILGFEKAFWTIFDANLTTLIAAVLLFEGGTGPIKGFAVTLSIGILCSMFTAIYVSRMIFGLKLNNKQVEKLSI